MPSAPLMSEQRPLLAAEAHRRLGTPHGKHLAREQLDERGLAGAVGAQQRHVLALGKPEVIDVKDGPVAAHHVGVVNLEERRHARRHARGSLRLQGFLLSKKARSASSRERALSYYRQTTHHRPAETLRRNKGCPWQRCSRSRPLRRPPSRSRKSPRRPSSSRAPTSAPRPATACGSSPRTCSAPALTSCAAPTTRSQSSARRSSTAASSRHRPATTPRAWPTPPPTPAPAPWWSCPPPRPSSRWSAPRATAPRSSSTETSSTTPRTAPWRLPSRRA